RARRLEAVAGLERLDGRLRVTAEHTVGAAAHRVAHLDQGFLDALDAGPGVAELEAADLVGRRAGVADYARAARPAAKGVDGGLVDLAAGREAAGLLERLEGLLGERAEHAV